MAHHAQSRPQCPRLPRVAGAPARATPTGLAAQSFPGGRGVDRWTGAAIRGVRRTAVAPLRLDGCVQARDGDLQHRHAGLEDLDIVVNRSRGLLPLLVGEWTLGSHRPRASAGEDFSLGPRERLRLKYIVLFGKD
jgi:hypothetical protein